MRRLRALSLVLALVVTGSPGCSQRSTPSATVAPDIVDLGSVSPLPYLSQNGMSGFALQSKLDEGVAEAATRMEELGGSYRDVYAGVVIRPEAAYVGLTRDHARILADLRTRVEQPQRLRAFKARYSRIELGNISSEIRHLVQADFPTFESDLETVYAAGMNRVMILVNFASAELVVALEKRFGDKIFILDVHGGYKRACPSTPGPCD